MFNWKKKVQAKIKSVEYMELRVGDIIVLQSDQTVSIEIRNDIYNSVKETLNSIGVFNEIILLTHGISLLLLRRRSS